MKLINRRSLFCILVKILEIQLSKSRMLNNLTVCFDIDGTIYDPYNERKIYPIFDFYKYCMKKGIRIIIITARVGTSENIRLTKQILGEYGIRAHKWYFMPNMYDDPNKYKEEARKFEFDNGNNIIMSLGDNICDVGKYGGHGVLIREPHTYNFSMDNLNIFYKLY